MCFILLCFYNVFYILNRKVLEIISCSYDINIIPIEYFK